MDAGGKGVNVSKTIRALGGDSIATGFIGGNSGIIIKKCSVRAGNYHGFRNGGRRDKDESESG